MEYYVAILRFHRIGHVSCTSYNNLITEVCWILLGELPENFFFQVLVCNADMIGVEISFVVFCERWLSQQYI